MMRDEDRYGSQTFNYKKQQHLLSTAAFDDPNPFLILPQHSYSHGFTCSDPYVSSNSTDDQATMFGSSLLGNMVNHEFEKLKSMDMMEDKALAASRNHSEAERRRRERINSHLSKLRSLLPNTTKTDKASLLAEVIQHVKDLKQRTSTLSELNTIPSEVDELTFETCTTQDGQLLIKASLCCDDRSDILQDLIKTFQDLNIWTTKADITTFAGRMKYVAFIHDQGEHQMCGQPFINTVKEAFKCVMGRSSRKDGTSQSTDASFRRRRLKRKE